MRLLRRQWNRRREYRRRVVEIAALTGAVGDIVMLGDSLTANGDWPNLLARHDVRNHGISGDTAKGVLARLDLVRGNPAQVYLLVGTNDISRGVDDATICANIALIIDGLRRGSPEAAVIVQSILPRQHHLASRIQALNAALRSIAESRGATFIDLWPALADSVGGLRPEFTNDQLHLLPPGYDAWAAVIRWTDGESGQVPP